MQLRGTVAYLIACLGFCCVGEAFANAKLSAPLDNFRSSRSLGMGGASVGVADDADAIFLNPAGIGREDGDESKLLVRGLSMPNASIGANRYTFGVFNEYRKSSEGVSKIEKAILQSGKKDNVFGYFHAFPYITISRFQFGLLLNSWGEGYTKIYDVPQTSQFSTGANPITFTRRTSFSGISQSALVAGFSLPYGATGFSLGVTGRGVIRSSISKDVESSEGVARKSSQNFGSYLNATKGVAIDLGLLYRLKNQINPSFGLTFKDISDTYYRPLSSSGKTEIDKMNLGIGTAVRPSFNKNSSLLLAFDLNRINDGRTNIGEKFGSGLEFGVGEVNSTAPFALRAGYGNRSPTLGARLNLLFFDLNFAHVWQRVKTSEGMKIDSRFYFNASVDLRT